MKTTSAILVAMGLWVGCAPALRRVGYEISPGAAPATDCPVKFVKYGEGFQEKDKVGSMVVSDNGFSTNCSEPQIIETLKAEACGLGATMVNLYNIREPSIFGSTCFQTYADFYRMPNGPAGSGDSTTDSTAALTPRIVERPVKIDTVHNQGHEFRIGMDMATVLSGGQWDLARLGLQPVPDGLSRTGFDARYTYWTAWKGLDLEYDYSLATADKAGYKSLSLYNQHLIRAGAAFAPIRKISSAGLHRIGFRGGINHDWLTFNSDSKITASSTAMGFGYYAQATYDYVNTARLLMGLALGFENKNPKLSGAQRALSADEFLFSMYFGYKSGR